jgi:hypothetical protein
VRLHRIVELRTKGWSWARIGKVMNMPARTVGNIIGALPSDPAKMVAPSSGAGEMAQPEPVPPPEPSPEPEPPVPEEELDETAGEPDVLEDLAAGAAEGTPLEDYIKRQKETEAQRINALPVPNS